MAMNELRKEVEAAAMAELNRANAKFPLFNSTHEGYAVILEEAEEAQEAMENVKTSLAVLWDRVKGMAIKREVRAIMAAIDKELGNYQSLAELDFRAGFVTGKIYEKEAAGLITPGYRAELIRILYAKYETIRDLESEGV